MYHKEQRLRFSEARKRDAINLYWIRLPKTTSQNLKTKKH
jgi:hypothetical protein